MSRSRAVDAVVVVIEGVFDVPAARRVSVRLAQSDGEVRVDLTRVREFHDSAVALLAERIAKRSARTTVLGLQDHHLRLLRYLGIDTGASLSGGVELT